MNKQTILIADDEPAIAETLEYALQCEGFSVETCLLGQEVIERVSTGDNSYALVVLDVGLPDINGFEVCKSIRAAAEIPVLFLTARSDELDRIVGLEIGADDYVVKPFSPREVATRIKVILRRYQNQVTRYHQKVISKSNTVLHIDTDKASVKFFDQHLHLTKYEYLLLVTLAENPERVYSRGQLMDIVWPDSIASMERSIDSHIKSLRSKLRKIEPDCEVIKTHRGLGYSLNSV